MKEAQTSERAVSHQERRQWSGGKFSKAGTKSGRQPTQELRKGGFHEGKWFAVKDQANEINHSPWALV